MRRLKPRLNPINGKAGAHQAVPSQFDGTLKYFWLKKYRSDQRTRTFRLSSTLFRAVCSEWVAIMPMMVNAMTSAQAMGFCGVCFGVSPFDAHTLSRFTGALDDSEQNHL